MNDNSARFVPKRGIACFLFAVFAIQFLYAQGTRGIISGTIQDQTTSVLQNVTV
jgi:hypothetical protein